MEKIFKQPHFFTTALIICTSFLLPLQTFAQGNVHTKPVDSSTVFYSNTNYNYYNNYNTAFNGWHGFIGINYEQFSNNGTAFAESSTNRLYNIDPTYQTGYNLGIGYLIPGKESDANLTYSHLHTSDSNSAWAPSLSVSPGSLGPVTWASSKLTFDYNAVNLTAGHMINYTPNFKANYYGGLNYTHLAKDMTIRGSGFGNEIYNDVGTSFNGFGPTFGMDGYCTPFNNYPNFNIIGSVNPTLAYGTMTGYVRTNFNDVRNSEGIPDEKIVVPIINSKLALNYDLPYKTTKLNFQLGYQLTELFGVTRETSYTNSVNASLQGAYFNVGIGF